MTKRLVIWLLALSLPGVAFAQLDYTTEGGTVTNTGTALMGSSTVVGVCSNNSCNVGNVGTMNFLTGPLASGSFLDGGTYSGGGFVQFFGSGFPNFAGTFSGPITWNVTLSNGSKSYTLTGAVTDGTYAGVLILLVTGFAPRWGGTYVSQGTVIVTGNNPGGFEFKAIVAGGLGITQPSWPQVVGATQTEGLIWENEFGVSFDWHPLTSYTFPDTIIPSQNNPGQYMFRALVTGVSGSGSTTPVWPQTPNVVITDGSVFWANIGVPTDWEASHLYNLNDIILPTLGNPGNIMFQVKVAGYSGPTEPGNPPSGPGWPQVPAVTVTEGPTWLNIGPTLGVFLIGSGDTILGSVTPPVGCQVNYSFPTVPNGYNDGTAAYVQYQPYQPGVVPPTFGYVPSPNPGNIQLCSTSKSGCALTISATMLNSFPPLSVTPSSLDSFLKSRPYYGAGRTPSGGTDQCELNWDALPLLDPFNIQMVNSGAVVGSTLSQVNSYLNQQICTNNNRVILQLYDEPQQKQHYILVTGQTPDGTDWSVFDGGWRPQSVPKTLGGHLAAWRDNNGNVHQFQVIGARTYAALSNSPTTLSVIANSPVELLVYDPNGRRLGSNASGQPDFFEIPLSSYLRDGVQEDPTTGGIANGDPTEIKTAYIPSPISGTYRVVATGTAAGTFTLTFRSVASDGTLQTATFPGITNGGAASTFQVQYSPTPGSSSTVTLIASFQSTLADISNSLALGLIDNPGIANALSAKIREAASATAEHETNDAKEALNAFKHQVKAQTGKHITGIAPQVLQEDADSLISNLH